jgi:prepilin-type N-terminal cleavage/methylation domain-containing protein
MRDTRYEDGFTLVELLVALMVVSIIFTAVATLAYALGAVNDATNDMAEKQAQVRYATLRISELIRHCKLICGTLGNDLAIWRADDSNYGQININELVYIEKGADSNYLRLCVFPLSATSLVNLSDIKTLATSGYSVTYVPLIPECNNVEFQFDVSPPNSKFVSISFDLVENGVTRRYQISAALRGWAGHLLDESGNIVDDDD